MPRNKTILKREILELGSQQIWHKLPRVRFFLKKNNSTLIQYVQQKHSDPEHFGDSKRRDPTWNKKKNLKIVFFLLLKTIT